MGILRAHTGAIGCIGLSWGEEAAHNCTILVGGSSVAGEPRQCIAGQSHALFDSYWTRSCWNVFVRDRQCTCTVNTLKLRPVIRPGDTDPDDNCNSNWAPWCSLALYISGLNLTVTYSYITGPRFVSDLSALCSRALRALAPSADKSETNLEPVI